MPKTGRTFQTPRDSPYDSPYPRRQGRGNVLIVPLYLTSPSWGTSTPRTGGTSMTVVLGPQCTVSINYGSKPVPGVPGIMTDLHRVFPHKFIAGHLLNDNMGGNGQAYNLTPLTGTANKNHSKKVEERIKIALEIAQQRARFYPQDLHYYGIKYTVDVLQEKMHDSDLLREVSAGIRCNASAMRILKTGGNPEELKTEDIQKFYFLAINQVIKNEW